MRRSLVLVALLLIAAPGVARASFHDWEIQEVFSNATGSIQYIELATASDSQQFVSGHDVTFTVGGTTNTFTFPGNSPSGTAGKTLLIATPGFARIAGAVTPDFTLPCGPLFDPAAASVTINFVGADTLTITTPKVPVDGINALVNGAVAAASPRNFAGTAGTMNLSACLNDGTCQACDDGLFCNGAEACASGACTAAAACPLLCNETTDTCFECDDLGDCNDANVCTDDSCNGSGICVRANNTLDCNDGLFCTSADKCSGGACVDTTDTCPGENCSEGGDFCGDCGDAADCGDGVFCNGDETCTDGACGAATAGPCDLVTTTCDEATDTCPPICGNGGLDGDEDCDDGNLTADDGCAACAVEDGFTCDDGEPSVCTAIPPPDAGVPDAEPSAPDAGSTTPPEDAGCCSTTGRGPATGTLLLLVLVVLGVRRRALLRAAR